MTEVTTTALSPAAFEQIQAQAGPVRSRAEALKAAATSLTIANATDANIATEFVARVAKIKKDNDAARRAHTDPLNAQVKEINAAFKAAEPLLDEADQLVRKALLAYQTEQQRIQLEAERRAAEERQRLEAAAEAERRRLAEQAETARRAAEEAERQRVAALQGEMAQKVAALEDEALAELADAADPEGDAALYAAIQEELRHRAEARRAADEAQAAADAARLAELQIQTTPAPVSAPVGPSRATSGSAGMTKRWTAKVDDPRAVVQAWLDGKVPEEFVTVNESAIGTYIRSAKGEHDQHPGIAYEQTAGLSVRTAA